MSEIQKVATYCLWLQRELSECVYGPYVATTTENSIQIRAVGVHGYEITEKAMELRLQKLSLISYIHYHKDNKGPYAEILYAEILNG